MTPENQLTPDISKQEFVFTSLIGRASIEEVDRRNANVVQVTVYLPMNTLSFFAIQGENFVFHFKLAEGQGGVKSFVIPVKNCRFIEEGYSLDSKEEGIISQSQVILDKLIEAIANKG